MLKKNFNPATTTKIIALSEIKSGNLKKLIKRWRQLAGGIIIGTGGAVVPQLVIGISYVQGMGGGGGVGVQSG